MAHLLDNPAWNALISGNENLSKGNEQVKYFPEDVSPFAGMPEGRKQMDIYFIQKN